MMQNEKPQSLKDSENIVEPEYIRGIGLGMVIGGIIMFQNDSILILGMMVGVAIILSVFAQYLHYIR